MLARVVGVTVLLLGATLVGVLTRGLRVATVLRDATVLPAVVRLIGAPTDLPIGLVIIVVPFTSVGVAAGAPCSVVTGAVVGDDTTDRLPRVARTGATLLDEAIVVGDVATVPRVATDVRAVEVYAESLLGATLELVTDLAALVIGAETVEPVPEAIALGLTLLLILLVTGVDIAVLIGAVDCPLMAVDERNDVADVALELGVPVDAVLTPPARMPPIAVLTLGTAVVAGVVRGGTPAAGCTTGASVTP